jgi:hypothetical protein
MSCLEPLTLIGDAETGIRRIFAISPFRKSITFRFRRFPPFDTGIDVLGILKITTSSISGVLRETACRHSSVPGACKRAWQLPERDAQARMLPPTGVVNAPDHNETLIAQRRRQPGVELRERLLSGEHFVPQRGGGRISLSTAASNTIRDASDVRPVPSPSMNGDD